MTQRSYPALKRVARLIQAVTIFAVAISAAIAVVDAERSSAYSAMILLAASVFGLLAWAGAELILMQAHLGEDMARVAAHAERMAAALDKEGS